MSTRDTAGPLSQFEAPERSDDDLTTPNKIANARRAAQEALRAAAERRVIDGELKALEYYSDAWGKYALSLEEQLNTPAGDAGRRDSAAEALDNLLGYPQDASPRPMMVGPQPLVVRATAELTSEKLCEVAPGTRVTVLEVCGAADARRRARITFSAREGWVSTVTKVGWVTTTQADGTEHLVSPTFAAAGAASQLSAMDRKARIACATIAAVLQGALGSREWQWHEDRVGEVGATPLSWLKQLEGGVKLLQAQAAREPQLKLQLAEQRVRADAAEAQAEQRLRRLRQLEDELNYSEARETALNVRLKELEDQLYGRETEEDEDDGEEEFAEGAYEDFGSAPASAPGPASATKQGPLPPARTGTPTEIH